MESYGALLKNAREQKELDYETVERETTLTRQYIVALETEDSGVFPGEPYLIGFLRNYAEYLGLDSEELIKLYHAKKIQESPVPPGLLERHRPKFLVPLVATVLSLIVVGVGVYLYFGVLKVPQMLAQRAARAQESTKIHQYTFDGQTQTRRLYKGDQIFVPSTNEEGHVVLTVGSTLGSLAVETPAGRQMLDLSEERDLDVDGDGIKDLILYLSDISATDESRGAEVRMMLRDDTYSALLSSAPAAASSEADAALLSQRPATVVIRDNRTYQFTLNISFRGPCLLRYQSEGTVDENYYQSGDILNITASRGNPIRLWISNNNALKIQVIADARTYDLDLGRAGEVMVEEVRWVRDRDGSRLVVVELD